mmetsp:Transcript_15450/g.38475  ORF Transcript_15450/g.38475 Transcript_15450/m.38475 type:complete len:219 (-) Transcript_15450:192-848(-)
MSVEMASKLSPGLAPPAGPTCSTMPSRLTVGNCGLVSREATCARCESDSPARIMDCISDCPASRPSTAMASSATVLTWSLGSDSALASILKARALSTLSPCCSIPMIAAFTTSSLTRQLVCVMPAASRSSTCRADVAAISFFSTLRLALRTRILLSLNFSTRFGMMLLSWGSMSRPTLPTRSPRICMELTAILKLGSDTSCTRNATKRGSPGRICDLS